MELIPKCPKEIICAACGKRTTVYRRELFGEDTEEYDFNEVVLSALEGEIPNLYFDPRWFGCAGAYIATPEIELCEHCHYVNTDITKKLHDKVNVLVQKPEYQNIFKFGHDDFQMHDWLAYLYLLDNYYFDEPIEDQEDIKNCMYDGGGTAMSSISGRKLVEMYSVAYLRLLDDIEQNLGMELNIEEKLYLEKTKSEYTLRFIHHLQKSHNLIDKLRLVELYREKGAFTKASEMITEIENKEESIFGVLRNLKKLVSDKDSISNPYEWWD